MAGGVMKNEWEGEARNIIEIDVAGNQHRSGKTKK